MSREEKALFNWLLWAGDNDLILAQRVAAWCGHAPVLEEDIALANVALDLIGQARFWLSFAGEVEGLGRSADDLTYYRDAAAFRNGLLVERSNDGFCTTLMRQFLFDSWHLPFLRSLSGSSNERVGAIAAKAEKEVAFHLERSAGLVIRLGDGTEESHNRMQSALDELWPYLGDFVLGDEVDEFMAKAKIAPHPETWREGWLGRMEQNLAEAKLECPDDGFFHSGGRKGHHGEKFGFLLAEMQFLPRAYPDAVW